MTQELIAWAAGILEGEGSFIIHKGKIRISCAMTDEDILVKLKEVLVHGSIIFVEKRKEHWKDSWVYNSGSNASTKEILDKILPYMGKRRTAKIQELYRVYEEGKQRLQATETRRQDILNAVNEGVSHTDVAKQFGVDRSTVSHLVKRWA